MTEEQKKIYDMISTKGMGCPISTYGIKIIKSNNPDTVKYEYNGKTVIFDRCSPDFHGGTSAIKHFWDDDMSTRIKKLLVQYL